MTPIDPLGWLAGGESSARRAPSNPAGWVDQWVKATTWWTDRRRWTDVADGLRQTQERMLLDLAAGILRQFTGRKVAIRRGGKTLRLVLDSLRVEGSLLRAAPVPVPGLTDADDIEVRVEAHDVEWAGCRLNSVAIVAEKVRLAPGVPARLTADVVDVTARARPADLIDWVQRTVGDQWTLTGDADGLVVAQPRGREVRLVVDPSLVGDGVNLEVRRVEWRNVPRTGPFVAATQPHPSAARPSGGRRIAGRVA